MAATWIITANASRARFFSQATGTDGLEEINSMVNAAVRLRTAETEDDRLGPTSATKSIHNTGGPLPNKTYEPPQTPEEHETELFARSVADYLLQERQAGRFDELILSASPQFLGVLRKLLDAQVTSAISAELNKDYTQLGAHQLREQIKTQRQKENRQQNMAR